MKVERVMKLEDLQRLLNDVMGTDDITIAENTSIYDIPNITSLTLIQIIVAIENKYEIAIPNRQLKKFRTAKDILVYINRLDG